MITLAEAEKLGRVHAVEPIVLSVYLNVPWSPAELPGLPARVDELVAAGRASRRSSNASDPDQPSAPSRPVMA